LHIGIAFLQKQDNDVMTACPTPTYFKLNSFDSAAALSSPQTIL
jgi:hypothetical protein